MRHPKRYKSASFNCTTHAMTFPLIPRQQFERMAANQMLQSLKQGPNRNPQNNLDLMPYALGLQLNQRHANPVLGGYEDFDPLADWDDLF